MGMEVRMIVIEPDTAHAKKNSFRNFVGRSGIFAKRYPRLDPMFVREFVMKVELALSKDPFSSMLMFFC